MTGGLDLLWLRGQLGCDWLYPLRDLGSSSQQAESVSELCLIYEANSDWGWWKVTGALPDDFSRLGLLKAQISKLVNYKVKRS
jgi:hypothetical protein